MTKVRDAMIEDLDVIVRLTRSQRKQLAEWSPVYFNPREGADDGHANFLAFVVGSDDHETFVLENDGGVVGFFVRIHQDRHFWIDDLCVDDDTRWPETIRCLVDICPTPWASCVAAADLCRRGEMAEAGLQEISTYYSRTLNDITPKSDVGPAADISTDHDTPLHTFGGKPFSPEVPGALVVGDDHGGFVIGSPGMHPPIYDPGGPTCIIDQIIGPERSTLVDDALAVAAGRGDAQVIVICDQQDQQLTGILAAAGFTPEVILIGSPERHG